MIVKYIQMFLQENYSRSIIPSGIYDTETHRNLLAYLNLSNLELNPHTVRMKLQEQFPDLEKYFISTTEAETITFTAKGTVKTVLYDDITYYDFLINEKERIYEAVEDLGWVVEKYSNVNSETSQYQIVITTSDRKNYFPNKEMVYYVNSFLNQYIYKMKFDGTRIVNDTDNKYRLAVIPCEPNTRYTIYHGYNTDVKFFAGFSTSAPTNIEPGTSTLLQDPIEIVLSPRKYYILDTPSDCTHIYIQVEYDDDEAKNINETLYLGAIYNEGKSYKTPSTHINPSTGRLEGNIVRQLDLDLLEEYINYYGNMKYDVDEDGNPTVTSSYELVMTDPSKWFDMPQGYDDEASFLEFWNSKKRLLVADTNRDGEIATRGVVSNILLSPDYKLMVRYYRNQLGVMTLGTIKYKDEIISDESLKMLVIKGDALNEDGVEIIPANDYYDDPWMVHEKFLSFLLDRCITPYSKAYDILYFKELYETDFPDIFKDQPKKFNGIYYDYIKEEVRKYQGRNGISFPLGYVDPETEFRVQQEASEV